ncbi:hypothetical protein V8B97DRAFT_1268466 [Scleroderma yunnanense]
MVYMKLAATGLFLSDTRCLAIISDLCHVERTPKPRHLSSYLHCVKLSPWNSNYNRADEPSTTPVRATPSHSTIRGTMEPWTSPRT